MTASKQVQALDRITAASKPKPTREHAPKNAVERVTRDWTSRPKTPNPQPAPATIYCHGCGSQNHKPARAKFRGRPGRFFICASCRGVLHVGV